MIDIERIDHLANIPAMQAAERPDATALSFEGRETSFKAFEQAANRVANGLLGLGTVPGMRVAWLGKNMDTFYEVAFGAILARGVITGINTRLAAAEIAWILNDCEAETLFVSKDFFATVEAIIADCPRVRNIICVEGQFADWTPYEAFCAAHSATPPKLNNAIDDDAVQLYTSGTTGFPKGVVLTNETYLGFFSQAAKLEWSSYGVGEAVMNAMPVFHVAGINVGFLSLAQGSECVVLRDIDPGLILQLIPEKQIAHAFWVPAVIMMLLQHPKIMDTDFSSMKNVFYGASPIAETLLTKAVEIMGARFTQLYGLTETVGAATYLPHEAHDPARGKLRSCGIPWPDADVRVVDPDQRTVATGEVGEIVIRSNFIMKGYWNRDEATKEAIRDGWFHTGDAGYFDDDGYLYIHDRIKDMIVSGGENVYPAEVENAIFGCPGVADVAVIGVPDKTWGEAVKAIIVCAPGESPAAADIIAFARQKIAGYKLPKSVDVIEAMPRNPSGKILRKDLREPYWKGADRRVS